MHLYSSVFRIVNCNYNIGITYCVQSLHAFQECFLNFNDMIFLNLETKYLFFKELESLNIAVSVQTPKWWGSWLFCFVIQFWWIGKVYIMTLYYYNLSYRIQLSCCIILHKISSCVYPNNILHIPCYLHLMLDLGLGTLSRWVSMISLIKYLLSTYNY